MSGEAGSEPDTMQDAYMTRNTVPVLLGALLLCAALGGCAGYSSWPPQGSKTALKNPNVGAPIDVMGVSLGWMLENHPPGDGYTGPAAINLPYGVNSQTYGRVVRRAGHGSLAATRESAYPTYHVVEIRVRGSRAEVDLMRPLPGRAFGSLDTADYQSFTLQLQGGLAPWRVTYSRPYTSGLWAPPGFNPIEAVREAEEAGEIVRYGPENAA